MDLIRAARLDDINAPALRQKRPADMNARAVMKYYRRGGQWVSLKSAALDGRGNGSTAVA